MTTTLLQEIFLYFAKYIHTSVMERIFTKAAADGSPYRLLREKAMATAEGIFPEITDYIFGVDEETVRQRISYVRGTYMFVDYGNISSSEDSRSVKSDEFNLAVTIARPRSSASVDMAEEILLADSLLQIVAAIRNDMRRDDSDSFVQRLMFPHDIIPFFAAELSNSSGWTLMFKMKGVDWL